MIYYSQKQACENGSISEFILILVFPVREHHRQTDQSCAVHHQPTAKTREDEDDQVMVCNQAQQKTQKQTYVNENRKLVIQLFGNRRPPVDIPQISSILPQAKLIMTENTQNIISSFCTILSFSSAEIQKAATIFQRPIASDKKYFRICDYILYSTFLDDTLLRALDPESDTPPCSLLFLRFNAYQSGSALVNKTSRCIITQKVIDTKVIRKANGNFYYSSYYVSLMVVNLVSPYVTTLQCVSGRQMRRGQKRKIMIEKGRRISLSPVRMLEQPNRDARMLKIVHRIKATPIFISSIQMILLAILFIFIIFSAESCISYLDVFYFPLKNQKKLSRIFASLQMIQRA